MPKRAIGNDESAPQVLTEAPIYSAGVITKMQLENITKHFCENRHNHFGVKIPMYYDETALRDMRMALAAGGIEVLNHGS